MTEGNGAWIHPDDATAPFFAGAQAGVLRLQRCTDCATWHYPLQECCQSCGSRSLDWADASGDGVIFSHARLQRPYHPRHQDRLPLVIAWIDLAEGVRMPCNVVGSEPADIRAGVPVRVDFEQDPQGNAFPVFRVVTS